jgi:YcxB-like protein
MAGTFIIDQELNLWESLSHANYMIFKMKIVRKIILFSIIAGLWSILSDFFGPVKHLIPWYISAIKIVALPIFTCLFVSFFISLFVIIERKRKPSSVKKATYRFTAWGMEKTSVLGVFTRPWNQFLKFRESRHFLILYITENDGHVIQKRMFKNESEFEEFKQLVAANVKEG